MSPGGDVTTYLDFRFLAYALPGIPAREHFESAKLVARLNLPNMAYAPEDKLEVYAHAIRGLTTLEPDPERRLKYLDFIDIYAALDENERIVYRQRYPEEVVEMTRGVNGDRFISGPMLDVSVGCLGPTPGWPQRGDLDGLGG
ncbi:MAG: hypothetical protein ACQETY_13230 [Pseudomonadota bacterium]